ncbi:glycosyltransferase [Fictibacillus enclensis]|uniref:glycosyltransferase n=1 Tax=Fictibacillus enclensis TaxID=1017270 RepID=UPI0008EE8CC7|nr:glycosyltransferase [Fictibacillus enclensis]MDM5339745.1 glycosyltransferase [Fictibacillus enclensis]SFE74714.1 Glycosyl transferase family 2 [Bacillus sp. OV194]
MISVILPVYNGGKFLKETIYSILRQTEENLELIIVNDGSTDNSEELIMSFKDERIRYFKQENKGVAAAFNTGLLNAEGDFVTFHGADDISLPHRFERMLEILCHEDIGFAHSDMLLITENGSPFGYWQSSNILPDDIYSFFLNVGTPFNNPTILFKKETVRDILYDETIKVGSDTDFILKVARGKWVSYIIPEPLYIYRRHQTNVTNQNDYEVLSRHVKLNICNEDLKNLTEADWNHETDDQNLLAAKLIAGVALSRRWMMNEAYNLFHEAIPLIKNQRERVFYEGMKGLVERDYQRAVNHFSKIENRNHLDENYLGEGLLFLKKYNQAYKHFLKALEIYPQYQSPVQNIKAIGMLKGHTVIDKRVNKYK